MITPTNALRASLGGTGIPQNTPRACNLDRSASRSARLAIIAPLPLHSRCHAPAHRTVLSAPPHRPRVLKAHTAPHFASAVLVNARFALLGTSVLRVQQDQLYVQPALLRQQSVLASAYHVQEVGFKTVQMALPACSAELATSVDWALLGRLHALLERMRVPQACLT